MMSKRVLVLAAAAALAPALAQAENTTCTNADFLMVGQVKSDTVSDVSTSQWYKFRMAAGRSYSVMVWVPSIDESENFVNVSVNQWVKDDCVTGAVGDQEFSTQEGSPRAGTYFGAASQFTPDPADCFSSDGCDYRLEVVGFPNAASSYTLNVVLVETTIHIPYWQVVTAAGYDAAPQIRNGNGGDTARFTVRLYDAAGTVVCTVAASVSSNGLATFSIASSCGISSGFGTATVSHNLQPGYVVANITTFSGNSGLSFDAPGSPRVYWSGAH